MARIINSQSLECLENSLLIEIEEANNQFTISDRELAGEKSHRQNEETVARIMMSKRESCVRHDVLYHCLCKIQNYAKEVEI